MSKFKVEVNADNGETYTHSNIDAISLVCFNTFGPAPVFRDSSFEGTVLYVNPQNIVTMEATK